MTEQREQKRPFVPESDPDGGGTAVINSGHYRIHEGIMWSFVRESALGIAGVDDILIQTPPKGCEVHLDWVLNPSGTAELELYEAPTHGGLGTLITCWNRKRPGVPAKTLFYHTSTAVVAGSNLMDKVQTGAGNKAGGVARASEEWILDANKLYLLRATSRVASNTVLVVPIWYEVYEEEDDD